MTLDFDYTGALTHADDERQFVPATRVGEIAGSPSFIRRDRTAEMAALTVSSEVQGQGDGDRLLKRIEQRAKAAAVRPEIVGNALRDISADPDVAQAVFDVLEAQKIINGKATVTLMPASSSGGILTDLLAAQPQKRDGGTPAVKA